jgi:FMN phosphatase YigB (HAD superfamily)
VACRRTGTRLDFRLFDAALEYINVDRARVLMIGHRAATDILGARKQG